MNCSNHDITRLVLLSFFKYITLYHLDTIKTNDKLHSKPIDYCILIYKITCSLPYTIDSMRDVMTMFDERLYTAIADGSIVQD